MKKRVLAILLAGIVGACLLAGCSFSKGEVKIEQDQEENKEEEQEASEEEEEALFEDNGTELTAEEIQELQLLAEAEEEDYDDLFSEKGGSEESSEDAEPEEEELEEEEPVKMEREETEDAETAEQSDAEDGIYRAQIVIADYGTITVELDADAAPETTENFVSLVKSGFYDGLTFHRIISGFMIQGGDPNGNGTGGSDKTIRGEFAANGFENPISHKRGVISMARSNDMNSASSQFFIMHEDAKYLDGNYAAFGYVTDGMDVVDQICEDAQPIDGNGTIPADAQPVIESITLID